MSQIDGNETMKADLQYNGYSNNDNNVHFSTKRNENFDNGEESGSKLSNTFSSRQKIILFLITLAVVLSSISASLLGPFLPIEAEKKGMKMGMVGIVIGLYNFVIFLTAPFYGSRLVRLGPKFVFTAGMFVGGCCNILFGTLQYCPGGSPFITMSIVIRVVEALGFSGFITSSFAIVSSEFEENIGFCFGILESATGLGFMVGPVIGGYLYELGGFCLPLYFAGLAVLVNIVVLYRFLPSIENMPSNSKRSMLTLLKSPMVTIPMCSVFVGMFGIGTFDSTFSRHLERMGLSVGITGLIFGGSALLHSFLSTIWGYLSDTKDIQAPLIVVGHLVFGCGFCLLAPRDFLPFLNFDLVTVMVGIALLSVSFGAFYVPAMKCMVTGATEIGLENNMDTFALVSGLFNCACNLGAFVGPLGIGYLIQEFDFPVAYTVVGLCSIFMMVVSLIFFVNRTLKRRAYIKH